MKILVCDDDINILNDITDLIKNCLSKSDLVISCNSYKELINNVKKEVPNILFIDIKLKDKNGIDFVKENSKLLENTEIIYITGYDKYTEDIFETNPTYFLRKPISKLSIQKALKKAVDNLKSEIKTIAIKSNKEIFFINVKDILYIESYARLITIHLQNNIITTYSKMNKILELLPNSFLKIHQSYVVNIDKIVKYRQSELELENKTILPISRRNQNNIKKIIINYIKDSDSIGLL